MNPSPKSQVVAIGALLFAVVVTPWIRVDAQSPGKTSVVIASVTDAKSGAPLADAEVTLSDLNLSARTDWSGEDRKSTRLNSSHSQISYAVFCLKKTRSSLAISLRPSAPRPPTL